MLAIHEDRMRQQQEAEKNLKKILLKRGEGVYDPHLQVVSYEGFKPAENKDIEEMTKADLAIIAKGHIKGISTMKKPQLLAAIKDFMLKNPGVITLGTDELVDRALATDSSAANDHGDMIAAAAIPGTADTGTIVSSQPADCAIQECDGNAEAFCAMCDLWFCKSLHGPHNSHSAQTHLKVGRVPLERRPGRDFNSEAAMEIDNSAAIQAPLSEPVSENLKPATAAKKQTRNRGHLSLPQTVDSSGSNLAPLDSNSESEPSVKRHKNEQIPDSVAVASSTPSKLDTAVRTVRKILEERATSRPALAGDQLKSALNYSTYDVAFLQSVAKAINIDVSSVAMHRRANRMVVVEYLVEQLVASLSKK
jgi:hypothetical protein